MNVARILPEVAIFLCVSSPFAVAGMTELVSVSSSGEEGNGSSRKAAISADGRHVAFDSLATNLVPGDISNHDIFVRDRVAGTTEMANVNSSGEQVSGDYYSSDPAISADGRYVEFFCSSPDLVPGDTNNGFDVFLRDRVTGTTELASLTPEGTQFHKPDEWSTADTACGGISADGRYVVFKALGFVYRRDRVVGATELVEWAQAADVSADGRYVVLASAWLVPDDIDGTIGVYVRDMLAGTIELISVSSSGERANWGSWGGAISADGRYVAFASEASNLVPGDTNGDWDIFVRDRFARTTDRVTVNSRGEQQNGHMWVPGAIDISADGRYVVFQSSATNLVPDDTNGSDDVFIRDRGAGKTARVSVSSSGEQANNGGSHPSISATGRYIVFESWSTSLVPAGCAGVAGQVFVRDLAGHFCDVFDIHWAYEDIEACANAGVVKGYEDNTYCPKYAVGRAQMAVYISRAVAGGDENVPDGPDEPSFPDVPDSGYGFEGADPYWAYRHVEYAVQQNIVEGYADGHYRPKETVNRGQMAVYIARALVAPAGDGGVPAGPAEPTFSDVTRDGDWAWCYDHVEYIAAEGVAQGCDDGRYHPEYDCTRDQMAVYIARAFDLLP